MQLTNFKWTEISVCNLCNYSNSGREFLKKHDYLDICRCDDHVNICVTDFKQTWFEDDFITLDVAVSIYTKRGREDLLSK